MAGVTLIMGRHANRDCERCRATARSTMTSGTAIRRPRSTGHMLSVIELDVEAFIKSRLKTLQRRVATANFSMANEAHGNRSGYKLPGVAIDAGFVSGKNRRSRIILPLVTRGAGK